MKPATAIVIIALLATAYYYRPVCNDTNITLQQGGVEYPLYACERMGWVEYLGNNNG